MQTRASSSYASVSFRRERERNDNDNESNDGIVALSDDESFTYSLDSINSRCGFPTEFVFSVDPSILVDRRDIRIGKVLGEGPNSVVYEGLYNSRVVAVKIIQPVRAADVCPSWKEKFQREVMLLSNMKHEGIVKFVGATVDPTMMVMTELMRGGTLQKHLASTRSMPIDIKQALTFALDISKAMEYLHARGVIHRDLKPSNILLNRDKTRVKLADFGLARELSGDMTTEAGTYHWMAPELFSVDPFGSGRGKKRYDHKVDVYSFSIVLWELMANQTPFKGRNSMMVAYATSMKVRPGIDSIPKEIVPLVQSCWSEDPKSRPEFRDITEYLRTLYYNLYPPEVRPKPQPASKVFDIGIPSFLNGGDDDDIEADGNDDKSVEDVVVPKEVNNNDDNNNNNNNNRSAKNNQPKKKSRPLLLRCFTC